MTALETLLRHRRAILAAYLLATAVLLPGVLRLESDNSPEVFFVADAAELERYRRLVEVFGNDQAVRLVVRGDGLWTAAGLDWLRWAEEAAAGLAGVERARGLHGHYGGAATWPPDPDELRRRAVSDPLARGLGLVSRDGDAASVLVVLEALGRPARHALLGRLEDLAETASTAAPAGLSAELVGLPVLNRDLDASADEIPRRFFPLLVVLAVVILALVFRRPRDVVVPLVYVGGCQALLLGTMGYAGVRLNLVLAILPPLVFVIALATAIHLLVRFRGLRETAIDPVQAVLETWHDKGWAILWTGLTTMVGFLSLATSELPPVRALGLWSGLGIALLTFAAFTLYPALVASFAGGGDARRGFFERGLTRLGGRWAEAAARRRRSVLTAAAAVAVLALAGVPRLRVESNALTYFPPEHPLRHGIEALEADGVGVAAVDLVLVREIDDDDWDADPLGFQGLDALKELALLGEELRRLDGVLGVVGGGDLMTAAVREGVPEGAEVDDRARQAALTAMRLERPSRDLLLRFVNEEGERARVVVFVPMTGFDRLDPLVAELTRLAAAHFPAAEVMATGEYPLLLAAQHGLFRTLAVSLGLTLLAVALIFRLLLPSTRLTLLALLPNLWPVALVLGGMGWLGVPIDSATVMVAAIVLGLAVDDTIHTLGHFRELAPVHGRFAAVAATLERTAPAYVLTGVVLAAGFGVCGFSSFQPTSRFGVLVAVAIVFAVLADLVLLPALMGSTPESVVLRLGRGREKGRGPSRP